MEPAQSWTLAVRGDSMRFMLKAGDLIRVRRAPLSELRAGDLAIVLDWRAGPPEYVVHRLLGRIRRRGALFAVTKGDANFLPDPLTPASAVVGAVDAARVGGAWLSLGPGSRAGGLVLAALGSSVCRALFLADRLCESALRLAWAGLSLSRPARGALMVLLAWRDRATARAYRRLQSLGARLTFAGEIAAPPDSAAARMAVGILDADQTWSGRIQVEGDVFVPPGVTLRVEPGTEIVFRADSQWDWVKECCLGKEWPQELTGRCRLLIGGRLIAEGTKEAPILFGGADWAGIHFVTDSWGSSLIWARLDRALCAAVTLTDSAQAALKFSELTECESGLAVFGRDASASLEDCLIARCRRRGLTSAGGALSASRVDVTDCGETAVFVEEGELELEDCALSGSPVGLGQSGGRSRLSRVRVSRAVKAGFEFDGGAHELRGAAAADCSTALSFGGGRLTLEGFEAAGCGSGVTQRAGELRWSGGIISGGRFGLESGGSQARVEGVSFQDQTIAACRVSGGALSLRGGFVRGGGGLTLSSRVEANVEDVSFKTGPAGVGIRSEDARLELRRASFDGGEAGILADKGSTRLDDCHLRGQTGPAAFQNGGALAMSGGEISGPGTGVRVASGRLELGGVRLEGPRLSIECEGAAVLESVELTGGAGGARFEGTAFELSRVNLSGARGVELSRGRLVWRSGSLEGGGLSIGSGAEAELEDIVVKNVAGHGASLAGGRLTAERCRFSEVSEAGVYVSGGGSASLTACSLRRLRYGVGAAEGDTRLEDVQIVEASEVGFSAESGRHRLARVSFHGCADRIHAAGSADVEVVVDPPDGRGAAAFKRALRAAVLRTRRLPVFGGAYRAIYALPVRALQLWAALDANAAALYAHRSWTRRDWDPGLSDVDLLVAARDLSGEAGRRWLERFWARFALLKGAFPFLGECLVAESAEFSDYARWGGFRARGFADQLVPLSGLAPQDVARPASAKAALEPLGELAHSYTRLMSAALWRPEPSQAGRSAARNAALDIVRLGAAAVDGGPSDLAPREAALAAEGAAGAALRAPLDALAAAESPRARAELCAEGLSRLHHGALLALASWPEAGASSLRWAQAEAESSPAGDVELRRRRGLAEEYARACGGALVAGCADDLYRTYLVLDDGAANPQTLAGVFEGLSRLVTLRGEPSTLPIVLTASAWRVWSRLAYLESPTRFLEPGGGPGDSLTRAGASLPGAWQYAWGRERLAPVPAPDALVFDLVRESLATLRCVWRYQASGASPLSSGYVQHYLLGRTMGLRLLLERGVGASFFALEPLKALYVREFPVRAPELSRLWSRLTERDGPAPWTELYAWVDAELRG